MSSHPKRDASNNIETILTLDANDANTKMTYASTRRANLTLNLDSPHTDFTHYTDAGPWADNYHRTLYPNGNGTWGVAGNYTYPSHPGWLVARDGVLYIDDSYTIQQMSIDSLSLSYGSSANPGLYSGNYWLFNAGKSWDANQSLLIAAWGMNGDGAFLNTPIYSVGYGTSHLLPSTGPGPAAFTATKGAPPYTPAYPVGLTSESIQTRVGTTTYGGSWTATNPESCNWALEYIWIPLSASVGGEQTWGSYEFKDLTTPGYRFWADGGNPTDGYYASGMFAQAGYATIGTAGSGFRNAMAWRLLWQPSWNDSRFCTSYAQARMDVSRTNTDGSQFTAGDGAWSGDISTQSFIRYLDQTS